MFTDDLKYVHFKPFECFHSSLVLIVISEKPESRCLSPVFFFFLVTLMHGCWYHSLIEKVFEVVLQKQVAEPTVL